MKTKIGSFPLYLLFSIRQPRTQSDGGCRYT
jgi:hypothetical protein